MILTMGLFSEVFMYGPTEKEIKLMRDLLIVGAVAIAAVFFGIGALIF